MNCEQYKQELDEAIFGQQQPANAPHEHLKDCASCREYHQKMAQLRDCIAHIDKLAEQLPDELVAKNRAWIMASIRERQTEVTEHRSIRDLFDLPLCAWGTAAVLVSAVFSSIVLFLEAEPQRDAQVAQTRTVPSPQIAAIKEVPPVPEPITLAALKQEFQSLKESQAGLTKEYLAKLRSFTSIVDDLDKKMKAQKLLVETYEQLGERDRARLAFGKHLEYIEERHGKRFAISRALGRADTLFYHESDYLHALAYYDLVLTRYPECQERGRVMYTVGQYYQRVQRPRQAIAEYRRLSKEIPGSRWAREADREIVKILYNAELKEHAYQELRQYAKRYPSEEAYAHFQQGRLRDGPGLSNKIAAMKEFRLVVEKYPDSQYAGAAKTKLAQMNASVLEQEIGTLIN